MAAKMKLTDDRIAKLPVPKVRTEYADAESRGLRLRIGPSGARVFIYYGRDGAGTRTLETLGRWGRDGAGLTVEEARRRYAERGSKPAAPPPPAGGLTVRRVADDFMKKIERERKRPEQARRPIDEDIIPAIGNRPITSVTPRDCRAVVEAVVARGSPVQAGVVFAVMKQLFRFAQGRNDIATNPAAVLDPGALGIVKGESSRYLTAEELPAFWRALDAYQGMTPTVRHGLRVLLLTGVRSGELLQATWDEVDFDAATWTIPVAHQKLTRKREKKARPFVVPLSPLALDTFRRLHDLANGLGSPNVMASFHAAKPGAPLTEKAMNHAMRRLFTGKEPVLGFEGERPTPHDLRRTVRTHLGETLGVPWHIAERCLNHAIAIGVTDTYDRGDYLTDRRAALEKWSAYVERLVTPGRESVAFLPAKQTGRRS